MILATTDMNKIKKTELEKMFAVYGNLDKKLDEKILQSLGARYFCHIICQNNIKCNVNGFVSFEDLEEVKNLDGIVKKDKDGKTFLNNKKLFVILSHSDTGVLAGVSSSKIGADIQKIKPYNEKIAKRYFSENEINYIKSSKNIDETFSLVWSFKESVFKSGYFPQKDFWKNSNNEKYSLFDNQGIKQILNLSVSNKNYPIKLCIFTRICGNFVITGICAKKEVILLVI